MFAHGAFACMKAGGWLLSSQAGEIPPVVLAIIVLASLGVLVLGVLGARSPYRAIRIHARITRAMTRLNFGPDWEATAERVGGRQYLEYLRVAPDNPRAYSARAAHLRAVLIAMAAVAVPLASCAALFLVKELVA